MKKLLKFLFWTVPKWFVILSVTIVLVYRWVPVTKTMTMLKRTLEYRGDSSSQVNQKWIPMKGNSTTMAKVSIAAEDPGFFVHDGFRDGEVKTELNRFKIGEREITGAGTLSQKTAQAVFMTGCNTWAGFGIRAWLTFLIEHIWGKRRIAEVYMNVAEYGPGLFGVEAASEHYYGLPVSELGIDGMAALALCADNPVKMTPSLVNTSYRWERYLVECQERQMTFPDWK